MALSQKAKSYYNTAIDAGTKLGDLRNLAKEIGKNHALATELWSTKEFMPRLLAILIMDNKLLTQEIIDGFEKDMQVHKPGERTQLMDWLMANQLTKNKKTIALVESWADSSSPLQRRTYWYYQARQRWTGQTPPANTSKLLDSIEDRISKEDTDVQWAMNFTAAWIGIYDKQYRNRCIKLGEKTGLYKDEIVSKGCTPNYLPEFIRIEAGKREKK